MSDKHEEDCLCLECATQRSLDLIDPPHRPFAAPAGSAELAAKLKSPDLTEETTTELEALAWRAMRAGEKEVEDAAVTVLCALQGYWKNPPNADVSDQQPERNDDKP